MTYDHPSSWPGVAVRRTASLPLADARPSTSSQRQARKEDVDARDKPGHDGRNFIRSLSSALVALPAAVISFLISAEPAYADLKPCNPMSYWVEGAIGIHHNAATPTRRWF